MKKLIVFIFLYGYAYAKTYNILEVYDASFSSSENYEISNLRNQYQYNEIDKSLSAFYPKLDLNIEQMKINEFPVVIDGEEKERRDQRRDVIFSAEQIIYDRSKILDYQIKKKDYFQSQFEMNIEHQEIMFNVIKYYLDALLKAKQIELLNQKRKRLEVIVNRASAKFESGFMSKADYYEAKLQYDELFTQIIKANLDYKVSISTLERFSGLSDIQIKKNIKLDSFEINNLKDLETKINDNIDVQIQKLKLEKSEIKISQSISKYEPILSLNYQQIVNDIPSSENEKKIFLLLRINLFNGFYDNKNYEQSRIEKNIETMNLNKLLKDIEQDVKNRIVSIKSYFNIIENYPKILEAKRFILDGMQERFDMGTKSIVDLLDEENQYFEKLNTFTQYKYQLLYEYGELMKNISGLDKEFLVEMDRLIYE